MIFSTKKEAQKPSKWRVLFKRTRLLRIEKMAKKISNGSMSSYDKVKMALISSTTLISAMGVAFAVLPFFGVGLASPDGRTVSDFYSSLMLLSIPVLMAIMILLAAEESLRSAGLMKNDEVLLVLLDRYSPVDCPAYRRLMASINRAMKIKRDGVLEMDDDLWEVAGRFLGVGKIRQGDDSVDIEDVIRWVGREREALAQWQDDIVSSRNQRPSSTTAPRRRPDVL